MSSRIRSRDRDAILQSLKAGVVPRRGLQHIQVGRSEEVKALMRDVDRIKDGGSAVRFIIGEYGSGKTFLLQLVRSAALEKGLVTMHADLAPDRRLHSSQGQARTLYAELARNLATRSKPEGGAMTSVIERFVGSARQQANQRDVDTQSVIDDRLDNLTEMVGGFAFAQVISAYWEGYRDGDEEKKANAIRWLRGEYTTKTDARKDLGTRQYIDDDSVYDYLKLFALFVKQAGYDGLVVAMDEMVNLYQITHGTARKNNYEQVLRIVNDCLQGTVEHLGFLFGGTPEFLTDSRRGLYSYEALRSRLQENTFANEEYRDLTGPVIRLASLSPEELYVLLQNLRHVHAGGEEDNYLVSDEALEAFMEHCAEQIGEQYFKTPRQTVKKFVQFLSILDQNPGLDWREVVGDVDIEPEKDAELEPVDDDSRDQDDEGGEEELTSFEL
ncbi:ATP-binding protein [Salinibacter altiplanensis]|uniref:ATP-binding protein n=1 Tax=Salinibacter altiplanensis TaxID=1803181 RepID=UPI000C9F2A40|nr:ATP-binding protein [Salinibacter altiplanensis]